MRHYCRPTLDNKIELTSYPSDPEMEVGSAQRLTPREAENLRAQLEIALEELKNGSQSEAQDA